MAELIKFGKAIDVVFMICMAFAYIALIDNHIVLAIALIGIDLGLFLFFLGFYIEVHIDQLLNQQKREKDLKK